MQTQEKSGQKQWHSSRTGTWLFLKGGVQNNLTCISEFFGRSPGGNERFRLSTRMWTLLTGIRKLMTEIPGTPPYSLSTNQSEAGHTPVATPWGDSAYKLFPQNHQGVKFARA